MLNRDNEIAPHFPQNRDSAVSKLRRDGKHCPLCLKPLRKIAKRTRLMKECLHCKAHLLSEKQCSKCGAAKIWENKTQAACGACGTHGVKKIVLAKSV